LSAALEEDFAAHRAQLALLKQLDNGNPARRMQVLRIEAQGLLQHGDALEWAAACMELYRNAGAGDEVVTVGRGHEAAVSRWVDSQLAALLAKAADSGRGIVQKTG